MPIKWLALECIHERRYTHKSDVWSYGMLAHDCYKLPLLSRQHVCVCIKLALFVYPVCSSAIVYNSSSRELCCLPACLFVYLSVSVFMCVSLCLYPNSKE